MFRLAQGCTKPAIPHVPGLLSPRVKLPWHEADRSPPSSAKVKNEWSHTSTLPLSAFMVWREKGGTLNILPEIAPQ